MRAIKSFLFIFTILIAVSGFGQTLSERATVSVITCGIGNEVYSLFGHTAIRISDPERAIDVVYNYGAFDFDTPNFVLRFSKGDLKYFVTAGSFADFKAQYVYENRSVSEQILNLTPVQKERLFNELNNTLYSDKRFYTYKFIDRNCTTMVVEILNSILGSTTIVKVGSREQTYREILYPYFNNHFYEQLGTSIIFGKKVDEKGTKIFLPIDLEQSLDKVKFNGTALLSKKNPILQIEPEQPFSWWNNVYTYLIFLILLTAANMRNLNLFYFLIAGAIGAFFSIAGLYSFHRELEYNYNILLFNPVFLLLIWWILRRNAKWVHRASLFAMGCIAVYLLLMFNKVHLLIVSPIIATNLILLFRLVKKK